MSKKQFRPYKNMEYRELLVEFISLLKPESYLEVGIKKGYTFKLISKFVERAVAVDPFPAIGPDFILDNKNVTLFKMTSQDFVKNYKGDKFDMIFIDGDHSEQMVLHDTIYIGKKFIKPYTGLIFLHDTYPVQPSLEKEGYCFDAWKAAQGLHDHHRDLEIVTIPGPWAGISICRYVPDEKHLHWS